MIILFQYDLQAGNVAEAGVSRLRVDKTSGEAARIGDMVQATEYSSEGETKVHAVELSLVRLELGKRGFSAVALIEDVAGEMWECDPESLQLLLRGF